MDSANVFREKHSIFPIEQIHPKSELRIVDDGTVDFHERADEHVAALTEIILEYPASFTTTPPAAVRSISPSTVALFPKVQ